MRMFAGLDVSLKTTVICVMDEQGRIAWRGSVASAPEAIADALASWLSDLAKRMLSRPGARSSLHTASTCALAHHGRCPADQFASSTRRAARNNVRR